MKVDCPYCNRKIDIMELLEDNDALAAIKMLNTFGKHANLVCAYTELFGIRPLKSKFKKWRLLLEEMKRLFEAESFTYQKRRREIGQAGIVEALNVVVHRNFADHLENHNYLKKIMITIAEREYQEKSRQGEKELRKREDTIMAGNRQEPQRATYKEIAADWERAQAPWNASRSNSPPLQGEGQGGDGVRRNAYPLPEEQVEPPVLQLTEEQRRANLARVANILKGLDK